MDYYYFKVKIKDAIPWVSLKIGKKGRSAKCSNKQCEAWISGVDVVTPGIPDEIAEDHFISYVNAGVDCIRYSYIERLGAKLCEKVFNMGRLFDEKGAVVEDWYTFVGKDRLMLRGGYVEGQTYWKCPDCGNVKHYPRKKPFYALKGQLSGELYTSNVYPLVVRSDLFLKIKDMKMPDLEIGTLKVKDSPIDKLPFDLS